MYDLLYYENKSFDCDSFYINWPVVEETVSKRSLNIFTTDISPYPLKYNIQDDFLIIGCKDFPLSEWKEFSPEDVRNFDTVDDAEEWWLIHKDEIIRSVEEIKNDKRSS